jgi:RIO-like serine/threonine protein kinase
MSATPRVLRDKGGFFSPAVSVITHEGRPAVLKDYRGRNIVTRALLGPALVRREFRILRHLEGIPGIPRAYATIDGLALVLEYIEGTTISKYGPGDLPDRAFEQLRETVRAMHRRGVVHLDLRQRKNIMIGPDRPYVIDFVAAVRVTGALGEKLKAVDESGLLKFKQRNFPHLVTDADRAFLEKHRFLRRFWVFTPRGQSVK